MGYGEDLLLYDPDPAAYTSEEYDDELEWGSWCSDQPTVPERPRPLVADGGRTADGRDPECLEAALAHARRDAREALQEADGLRAEVERLRADLELARAEAALAKARYARGLPPDDTGPVVRLVYRY